MNRQTDTEFLHQMHVHAALTDTRYLRYSIEDRDRLCRLAGLGEDFWPELKWAPPHSEVMALLQKARDALIAKAAAAVAKKLTS